MASQMALGRMGRSVWLLLSGILLFHAGWYMLLPFIAILFTSRRGFSPAEVGLVLAAQSFTLLAGSLAGGFWADRKGRRPVMVVGLLLRAAGLFGLGLALTPATAALAAGVAGLGGGAYGPSAKAGIAAQAVEEIRPTAFAARGIAASIGTSLGPVAGGLFIRGPMIALFSLAAGLHLALAAATWLWYREERGEEKAAPAGWRTMLADGEYLLFSLVTVLAWALFAQLMLAVPLYARSALGLERSIGLLWTLSSLAVVICQFAVTRWAGRRLSLMGSMALGTLLLGAGLGLVPLSRSFYGLLGAVLIFVAGEMLVMPAADSAVSAMAEPGALGAYFGLATVAWGAGEGLGNLAGGALVQLAAHTGRTALPWLLYGALGLGLAGLYWALGRKQKSAGP